MSRDKLIKAGHLHGPGVGINGGILGPTAQGGYAKNAAGALQFRDAYYQDIITNGGDFHVKVNSLTHLQRIQQNIGAANQFNIRFVNASNVPYPPGTNLQPQIGQGQLYALIDARSALYRNVYAYTAQSHGRTNTSSAQVLLVADYFRNLEPGGEDLELYTPGQIARHRALLGSTNPPGQTNVVPYSIRRQIDDRGTASPFLSATFSADSLKHYYNSTKIIYVCHLEYAVASWVFEGASVDIPAEPVFPQPMPGQPPRETRNWEYTIAGCVKDTEVLSIYNTDYPGGWDAIIQDIHSLYGNGIGSHDGAVPQPVNAGAPGPGSTDRIADEDYIPT